MFFKASLQQLYLEDERPWLVGFSGGKDSIRQPTDWRRSFLVMSYPSLANRFAAPSTVYRVLTTVFTIPAIAEMIEGAPDRMRRCSQQFGLNIQADLSFALDKPRRWGLCSL